MLELNNKSIKPNHWMNRPIQAWSANQVLQYVGHRNYMRFGTHDVPASGRALGMQWSFIKNHIIVVLKERGYGMCEVKEYVDYVFDRMCLANTGTPFPLGVVFNKNWVQAYINSKKTNSGNFLKY